MEERRRKRLRRIVMVVVAAIVVIIAIGRIHGNQAQVPGPQSPVPAPSVPNRADSGDGAAPKSRSSGEPEDRAVTELVAQAALDVDNLSEAQLLPSKQMHSVVASSVVPSQRARLAAGLTATKLWQAWGYVSASDANIRAQYYVQTQKYRVLKRTGSEATVALYTWTHWLTSISEEYTVPGLTYVKMRRVGQRWMYVQAVIPPENAQPVAKIHLSLAQTETAFEPYLKGYRSYAANG